MSKIDIFEFNTESLTTTFNEVKDLVIDALVEENKLSKNEADEFKAFYYVIPAKPSMLGNFVKKLFGKNSELTQPFVCKMVIGPIHKESPKKDMEGGCCDCNSCPGSCEKN
jgi:hypothetical protein